jgi:periplasmic divalent cation tolerance protein
MKAMVVLVTVSSAVEGRKIGGSVVRKKLAACVNQVPGLVSTYWWKGKIETAREDLLIFKTSQSRVPALIKEVKKLHSYTVPEIIALPIVKGNKDYLKWIEDSIRG